LNAAHGVGPLTVRVAARYLHATAYQTIGHRRGQECPNCKLPAFCEDCRVASCAGKRDATRSLRPRRSSRPAPTTTAPTSRLAFAS
jgi:hypothetical protein